MTQPKSDPLKSQVIVDLSFPPHENVHLSVPKNVLFGKIHDHSLPTIDHLVDAVQDPNFHCLLATVDTQRAYQNILCAPWITLSWG